MNKFLVILPFIIIIFSFVITPYVLACFCYCNSGTNTYNYEDTVADETECQSECGVGVTALCGSNPGTGSSGGQVILTDPLDLKDGPEVLYARLISALLAFVGIASLVTFVYAGFLFLTSAGNQERVKKAKDTMFYSILGVVLAIASYAILSFIFSTLEKGTGN